MKTRRFHVYAGQEDLQDILKEFQEKFDVYYVPAYSDKGPVSFRDATSLEGLGTNVSGSHLGNRQLLAFMEKTLGRHGESMLFVMLTDIIHESTELLCYGGDSVKLVREAFGKEPVSGSVTLPGVVSRKKQLIPAFMDVLQQ